MYQYGQYCPVARAAEILGDRWTLLILRDLVTGTHHFNDLERGLPGISRGVLAKRLRRLEEAGIIEKRQIPEGRRTTAYHLTNAGEDLEGVLQTLTQWSARWIFDDPSPDELDAPLLLWWMRGRVKKDQLPKDRIVVEFDFVEDDDYYWLVMTPDDVSVCQHYPGYEVDVVVTAELGAYFELWQGKLSYREAVRTNRINLEALPALKREFPTWFTWSPIAGVVKATAFEGSNS
jgi:DNA-binding HxlR family transcriptional regulator